MLPLTSKTISLVLLGEYPNGFPLEFPPIVVTFSFDKIIFPVFVVSFILKSLVEDMICIPFVGLPSNVVISEFKTIPVKLFPVPLSSRAIADNCPGLFALNSPESVLLPNDNLLNGLSVPTPNTIFSPHISNV